VANTLAELIIGGSLTSFEIIETVRETGSRDGMNEHDVYKPRARGPFSFRERASGLG